MEVQSEGLSIIRMPSGIALPPVRQAFCLCGCPAGKRDLERPWAGCRWKKCWSGAEYGNIPTAKAGGLFFPGKSTHHASGRATWAIASSARRLASSREQSSVAPAAWACPPPPSRRQASVALTRAPVRRLILLSPSASSRIVRAQSTGLRSRLPWRRSLRRRPLRLRRCAAGPGVR